MIEYSMRNINLEGELYFSTQDGLRIESFDVNEGVQSNTYEGLNESEQIEKMADYLNGVNEIKYDNWEKLSLNERLNVMQDIENKAAEIEGRVPLQVKGVQSESSSNQIFTAGRMDWGNRSLEINVNLLEQNSLRALNNCVDTVLHEGRHAYQWSNLMVRRTEPSDEKFNAWNMNLNTGYLACEKFGFERYSMQPVELDARVFAEEIRSKISYR